MVTILSYLGRQSAVKIQNTEFWNAGTLEHRNVGTLEHRNTGTLKIAL
jgi:hypothetical protein